MKDSKRRILRNAVITLGLGLVVFGWGYGATREPWGASDGFPFRYSYPNLPCYTPNSFNGCGYSYDPLIVLLDYLISTAFAAGLVYVIHLAWTKFGASPKNRPNSASIN